MTTYVAKVKETDVVKSEVYAPVKACMTALINATSVDDIKTILRESKPTNETSGKTVGIMRTSLAKVCYSDISSQCLNVITTTSDEVILTENATILGMTEKFFFIFDGKSNEYRRCYKPTTFFVIGE